MIACSLCKANGDCKYKNAVDELLKELKRKNSGYMTVANNKRFLIQVAENRLKEERK